MSDIKLAEEGFGLKLYERFPSAYQTEDVKNKFALRRYLDALAEGGFRHVIHDLNGILDLYDVGSVPSVFLPALLEQFGLDVYEGIPEEYLRFLLPRLGESWSRKGNIDVIDFVVTVLSNLKTETTTTYDADGVPEVNVRIEMDYDTRTVFPDPYQFARLLRKYLPYYVDSTLVYVYVFYEATRLFLKEKYFLDLIRYQTSESAFIPYAQGTRPYPQYNQAGVLLNRNAVFNGMRYFPIDVDWFHDLVRVSYSESAGLFSKHSHRFYRDVLNNPIYRLNRNLFYNDWCETDYTHDRVAYLPVLEHRDIHGTDTRFDHTTWDHEFRFDTQYNTRHRLNNNLIFNAGNTEVGEVHALEGPRQDQLTITVNETGRVKRDVSRQYYLPELNVPHLTLNGSLRYNVFAPVDQKHDLVRSTTHDQPQVHMEDPRSDHAVLDHDIVFTPVLNTSRRFNADLTYNRSNMESAYVRAGERSLDTTFSNSGVDRANLTHDTSKDLYFSVYGNTPRLNTAVRFNQKQPVDQDLDSVRTSNVDFAPVQCEDALHEDLHLEVQHVFVDGYNSRHRLNRSLKFNQDNGERAEVRMTEDGYSQSVSSVPVSESAGLHFKSSVENRMGSFFNVPESRYNDAVLSVPDITDVVTVGGVRTVVYVTPRICVGL